MQNKWMTREEFERQAGDYSHCWVACDNGQLRLIDYQKGFYFYGRYELRHDLKIKAVMPIEKPEYPKEVG